MSDSTAISVLDLALLNLAKSVSRLTFGSLLAKVLTRASESKSPSFIKNFKATTSASVLASVYTGVWDSALHSL